MQMPIMRLSTSLSATATPHRPSLAHLHPPRLAFSQKDRARTSHVTRAEEKPSVSASAICPQAPTTGAAQQLLYFVEAGLDELFDPSLETYMHQLNAERGALERKQHPRADTIDEFAAALQERVEAVKRAEWERSVQELMYVLAIRQLKAAGAVLLPSIELLQITPESTLPAAEDPAAKVQSNLVETSTFLRVCSEPASSIILGMLNRRMGEFLAAESSGSSTTDEEGRTPPPSPSASGSSSPSSGDSSISSSEEREGESATERVRVAEAGTSKSAAAHSAAERRRRWTAEDFAAQRAEDEWWAEFMRPHGDDSSASTSAPDSGGRRSTGFIRSDGAVLDRRMTAVMYHDAVKIGYMSRQMMSLIDVAQREGRGQMVIPRSKLRIQSREVFRLVQHHVGSLMGLRRAPDPLASADRPYPELENSFESIAAQAAARHGSAVGWHKHRRDVVLRRLSGGVAAGRTDDPDVLYLLPDSIRKLLLEGALLGFIVWEVERHVQAEHRWDLKLTQDSEE